MKQLLRLIGDRTAASAAEFAMILPLLLAFLIGITDVGRLMWTWNRAEKATQMGVRYAVVTDMVPATLAAQNFAIVNGVPGGDPVPACGGAVTSNCFSSTTCTNTACSGGWGYNSTAFANIVTRMKAGMPEITPANVEIDYENVGLGYAGDPFGPDVAPLVTVRLKDMDFRPLALMVFDVAIQLPDFSASLTAEDSSGTVSN